MLLDQYPCKAKSYHHVLRRIAGGVYEIALCEYLLHLVNHYVTAETLDAEVEKEGVNGCVCPRIIVIKIKTME